MTRRRSALVVAGILSVAVAGWLGLRVAGPAWTLLQHPKPKHARTASARPARQATAQRGHPRLAQVREAGEHEAARADAPGEALRFYLRKREDSSGHMRPQNYLAARQRFAARRSLTNVVPAAMPAKGGAATQSLAPTTTAPSLTWKNIGPGNVGGRTRALIVDSTNSSTLWAGGVDGGIWKSTNSGASWTLVTDLLPNIAVTTLAQDPLTPTTLYAGTGEGYGNVDAERGDGIFVSTNGGTNWSSITSTASNADFHYVNRIVVSPTSSGTLYVATNTGVWKGTGSGHTWTWSEVLTPLISGDAAFDVAVEKGISNDYVYAFVSDEGLYVSTDSGANFAALAAIQANINNYPSYYRGTIAMSPTISGTGYVVVATDSSASTNAGGITGVWKTTDHFASATEQMVLNAGTPASQLNAMIFDYPLSDYSPTGNGKDCSGNTISPAGQQGWYDQAIAVDPTNPSVVWLGGIDLYRSDDDGQYFSLASDWSATPSNTTPQAGATHSDQHAIVFSPNYATDHTIYFGNDGGIYKTTNPSGGTLSDPCSSTTPANPVAYLSLNNSYGVTQFYNGSVPTTGTGYIAGAQDNGTQLYQGGVDTWKSIYGGDGGDTAIDPTDANRMYFSYTNISVIRSDDGGATNTINSGIYNYITAGSTGITSGGTGLFINPYVLDSNTGFTKRMYVTNNDLWMTDDATTLTAPVWANVGSLNPAGTPTNKLSNGSALAVAPNNSNVVYVGMANGTFYKLLNPQ